MESHKQTIEDIDNPEEKEALAFFLADMQRQDDELKARRAKNKKMSFMDIQAEIDIFKSRIPAEYKDRVGNCFRLAYDFIINHGIVFHDEKLFLIHGYGHYNNRRKRQKEIVAHAWVQLNNYVYDPVFDVLQVSSSPAKTDLRFEPVHKFSPDEAAKIAEERQHMGPWNSMKEDVAISY